MTAEYALNWILKKHKEKVGTLPLALVSLFAELMCEYGDELVDWTRKRDAEKAEMERSLSEQPAQVANERR